MKYLKICLLTAASVFAQNTPDAVDQHLIAARNAAGFDFTDVLARLCVALRYHEAARVEKVHEHFVARRDRALCAPE